MKYVYALEVEYQDGHKRLFKDIISIDVLEKSIRIEDNDGIIIYVDVYNKKNVRIISKERKKDR